MNPVIASAIENPTKRTVLLTLLCIMTFISSSIFVLISIVGIFSSHWVSIFLEQYTPGFGDRGGKILLLISFGSLLVFGFSLWGSILMFFRKKIGFILYIIPNGVLMILNILICFVTFNNYSIGYLVLSILFIILYSTQVKTMK